MWWLALAALVVGCTGTSNDGDAGSDDGPSTEDTSGSPDADTDADSDADADADADTDSDADVDTAIDSGTGGPTVDPASLVGRTYLLDYAGGKLVTGSSLLELDPLLIGVAAADDAGIDFLMGVPNSDNATQDLCDPTAAIPTADLALNPLFGVEPTDWVLQIDGIEVTFLDFEFRGELAQDGTEITRVYQAFALSADDIGDLADLGGVCSLLSLFGAPCEPCPDGVSDCAYLAFDQIPMTEVPGLTLVPRTDADIAADPACQ